MKPSLNILTYNIHKGFSVGKIKFLLPAMRTALSDVNADIVFLQEVQGVHKKREKRIIDWPVEEHVEFLAHELWPHYAYGKNAIYEAGHHGNAILSKYPFIYWENVDVSTIARASRSVLHGILQVPNHPVPVHVMCIHFGIFNKERRGQFQALSARLQKMVDPSEPLIIGGDFNDWRQDARHHLEADLGLKEVFKELQGQHAKTFPAWRPTLLADRIYYRGLELAHGACLNEKPWKTLSDHLPLTAKFNLI